MSMNGSRYARHYQQRGAFTIMTAGVLAMALLCLVLVVDSGRLYMEQRSLQRVADMAALEAVSRGGDCRDTSAMDFATDAATRNRLFQSDGKLTAVNCVELKTNDQGVREFKRINDDSQTIRVIVEKITPASLVIQTGCLFTSCENEVTLQAEAVAGREEPIAAFSVGSRLIRFDNESVLGGMLKLVGADLHNTEIAGYNGLATVNITPAGLLQALNLDIPADLTIGGLNDFLALKKLSVGEILDAAVTVVGSDHLINANAKLLNALNASIVTGSLDLTIPLLTQPDGTPGLFAEIIAPATQSASAALSAEINALSIIETVLGLATHERALSVDKLDVNLLGLVEVKARVGVVEPPSITIGSPTRRNTEGQVIQEGATAYTAQVRAFIHIKTGGLVKTLNNLVSLLGISNLIHVDLPIALDLVTGQGVLEEKTCTAAAAEETGNLGRDHAEIAASGTVGKICIGSPIDESQLFSKTFSCEHNTQGTNYLNILGLVKLQRSSPLTRELLKIEEEPVFLSSDNTALPSAWSEKEGRTDFATVGNPLLIGDLVENLVGLLLELLLDYSTVTNNSSDYQKVASVLWEQALIERGISSGSCGDKRQKACRVATLDYITDKLEGSDNNNKGLLGGLLSGLGDLLGGLLSSILGGNGCTENSSLLGLGGTSDANCISVLQNALPDNTTQENHLGVGILTDLLNTLGNRVLQPILEDLLGLHVGEVDVHLQDLNCGHARLLQ